MAQISFFYAVLPKGDGYTEARNLDKIRSLYSLEYFTSIQVISIFPYKTFLPFVRHPVIKTRIMKA